MIALLDVNVLVALFDPDHLYHDTAHAWFARNRSRGWVTCPLTENALVRILSNAAYPGHRTTLEDAAARLQTFCSDRQHTFWPDSVSIRDPGRLRWSHVQGHRQLTDVYLLALAVSNRPSSHLRLRDLATGGRRRCASESRTHSRVTAAQSTITSRGVRGISV